MSIKIHHGPPGSYKTSGAIADDLLDAVVLGRHIITNVRGLSDEQNIRDVIVGQGKKVPDSFKLTYIKTDPTDQDFPEASCSENMEMLRRFWHWAPDNVFFILDEVQEIWPKSYRETHLRKLDYPGGIEAANQAGRFLTIDLAFEKHRHKNWDFVVTTPNINKVHPVIRGSAEAAYKHKNLAVLGSLFKGRYIEGFHSADTNGKASDFYSVIRKKIPTYVFKLYKSTATGVVRDTTAGQSIFKDPKVLGLSLFILCLIAYLTHVGMPAIFTGKPAVPANTQTSVQAPTANSQGNTQNTSAHSAVNSPAVRDIKANSLPSRLSFLEQAEKITLLLGYREERGKTSILRFILRFEFKDNRYLNITEKTFARMGLVVSALDDCMYEIKYKDVIKYAYCNDVPPPVDPVAPVDPIAPVTTAYNDLSAAPAPAPLSNQNFR